jgi:dipeptidyl aminopeptidase/acylaminoacyl peptidase
VIDKGIGRETAFGVSRRGALTGGLAAVLAAAGGGVAVARSVRAYDTADFFSFGGDRSVRLSPAGTRIAVLRQVGTEEASLGIIDVIDAADPEGKRRQILLGPIVVEAMQWGNDERLLVRVAVTQDLRGRARTGSNIRSAGFSVVSRRIVSVDAVSGEMAVLFQDQRARMRGSLDLGNVTDILPHDPDHVLMTAVERDGVLGLHRVNIQDGSAERVERGNSATVGWETQRGVPVIRYDINSRGNLLTIHGRSPGETDWRFVRRSRVIDTPEFAWIGETETPGVALVAARAEGEDVETIREMDLRTFEVGPPKGGRAGRDVIDGLKDSAGRFLGSVYYGERLEYDFEVDGLAPHHRALNRFLEDDCDVRFTDVDAARNRFLAYASGPREPGAWFFYDKATRAVAPIASRMSLDPARLGEGRRVEVETRDGARIEAYLTIPSGGRPGPVVALVHGGPEVRDYRGWDRQAQALAARGWWVVQPNFRGSGGYGQAFASGGWKRWGDRMQQDVEDAVAQVVRAHGLDGDRVAIMGTSYGGYAALMGAVLRPDLYKAAISICGLGDMPDILEWEKRQDDTPGQPIYAFWTKRIGDLETDRVMLEAASPRRRAAEIACPVLLVHGEIDGVVPVSQSRRMNEALKAARKSVEYVEVAGAGHADWSDAQEKALIDRYVALLARAFA